MFFTPGVTFAAGDQVTATKLNNLVANAVPMSFNRTHFDASTRVISVAASETNGALSGELFYSTLSSYLAYHNGSRFLRIAPLQEQEFTVASVASAGDVLIMDTSADQQLQTTATDDSPEVVGVLGEAVSTSPSSARVATSGIVTVNCSDAAVSRGDYMTTSSESAGKAKGSSTPVDETFGRALTAKATGSGSVVVLLNPLVNTNIVTYEKTTASYATSTSTAALLSADVWYDVPNAAVGASVTTNGNSAMDIDFTTTVENALVSFKIENLRLTETGTGDFKGIRFLLDGTAFQTFESDGTGLLLPSAAGEQEVIGPVSIAAITGGDHRITVPEWNGLVEVPTTGAHTIRVQFLAGNSTNYTMSNGGQTATLTTYEHYT